MIVYQKFIQRADLKANPGVLYVFGDNLQRVGNGGQARDMRGERNAVGIPTKRSPHIYLSDKDFDEAIAVINDQIDIIAGHQNRRGVVVFPSDGIGTGLANLASQAPQIWAYLCHQLDGIGIRNGGHHG